MKCNLLIVGVILLILLSGCAEQTDPSARSSTPQQTPSPLPADTADAPEQQTIPDPTDPVKYMEDREIDESAVCSNSEYSAEIDDESWMGGHDEFITLDSDSKNKLEAAVEENGSAALQGISDLTCLEYLNLSAFDRGEYYNITDISALNNLTNLKVLLLKSTPITDLSPISNLTNLLQLNILEADISDLTPVSSLTQLISLNINMTSVSDLTPLSTLSNLRYFNMNRVQVTDVTPIANLTSLKKADLMYNEQIPREECVALREELPEAEICCPGWGGCD